MYTPGTMWSSRHALSISKWTQHDGRHLSSIDHGRVGVRIAPGSSMGNFTNTVKNCEYQWRIDGIASLHCLKHFSVVDFCCSPCNELSVLYQAGNFHGIEITSALAQGVEGIQVDPWEFCPKVVKNIVLFLPGESRKFAVDVQSHLNLKMFCLAIQLMNNFRFVPAFLNIECPFIKHVGSSRPKKR